MKKLLVTLLGLSLFVASCGDDDATTTTAVCRVPGHIAAGMVGTLDVTG